MATLLPSSETLILPCSHHPSLATQPSPYPPLRSRTRFTSSQRRSLLRESRISLAMHVGAPLFICLPIPCFITSCLRRTLGRQRKVKCHQLPGQLKVCLRPFFHSICSTNHSRPIPSAKYSTPLACLTNSLTLSYSALYGQKLSMHVRSPRPFSPRCRVDVTLFRHHAQQATSEKKRVSTVSRRPRAYTASTQHRSVLPLSSMRQSCF
jgi:hypothetical protein